MDEPARENSTDAAARAATALKAGGRILFGVQWFDGLRAMLDVSEMTLNSWLDGSAAAPSSAQATLDGRMATLQDMQAAQQRLRAFARAKAGRQPG